MRIFQEGNDMAVNVIDLPCPTSRGGRGHAATRAKSATTGVDSATAPITCKILALQVFGIWNRYCCEGAVPSGYSVDSKDADDSLWGRGQL